MLTKEEMQRWFRSFWTDIRGSSTRNGHPAPFPAELAERLIKMFSFAGDTILDPFMGVGSTSVAAIKAGRNSIGNELEPAYFQRAWDAVNNAAAALRTVGATRAEVFLAEEGTGKKRQEHQAGNPGPSGRRHLR